MKATKIGSLGVDFFVDFFCFLKVLEIWDLYLIAGAPSWCIIRDMKVTVNSLESPGKCTRKTALSTDLCESTTIPMKMQKENQKKHRPMREHRVLGT